MYFHLLPGLSLTILSNFWDLLERPISISVKGMIFIFLWEDCPPEDSTLKHHRHLGCCRPFSVPLMSIHFFVLSLPSCPVLSVNICILSGLPPLLPWKENTSHMLFSILYNYKRSCTIIYYTSFSLHAKCHILQPLSFPRQITVSASH